jgi:putative transposase
LYVERQVKPRRADDATRITLVALSRLAPWRDLLTIVKPDTLIRWHRRGFQLLWRWKSRPRGRPPLPADLRRLITEMASANRTWGEKRIASELLVKLGIHVSLRTVRRYMPTSWAPRGGARAQRWSTFVRNHASAVLACDFFVVVNATFRVYYVFVVLEVGSRRIRHWNVTAHPRAEWTAQQFRTVMSGEEPVRCLNRFA